MFGTSVQISHLRTMSTPDPKKEIKPQPRTVLSTLSAKDLGFIQTTITRYYDHLLEDWQEATHGTEQPPTNFTDVQCIDGWSLRKLETTLHRFVFYLEHADTVFGWGDVGFFWDLFLEKEEVDICLKLLELAIDTLEPADPNEEEDIMECALG